MLSLTPAQRGNLVAMRTVLAVVFVLCLALDIGVSTGRNADTGVLQRADAVSSAAFFAQVSLGGLFVITGVLVTHHYLRRAPGTVWRHLLVQTLATVAATVLPAVVLAASLGEVAAPTTVLKVLSTVLPAWIIGSVTVAVVFRTPAAKRNVTKIAPALLAVSMLASMVLAAVLSHRAPVVGTDGWMSQEFSWVANLICAVHLSTYFFAGSLVVSIGDGLLRRRTVLRFLLPVIGVVFYIGLLPFALAGVDIGQPFMAVALAPLVFVTMPSVLAGRDLWLGLVIYAWPIHLILLAAGGSAWGPLVCAAVVCVVAVVLATLSWRHVQRPVVKALTARGHLDSAWSQASTASEPGHDGGDHLAGHGARDEHGGGARSARFRLLEAGERDLVQKERAEPSTAKRGIESIKIEPINRSAAGSPMPPLSPRIPAHRA